MTYKADHQFKKPSNLGHTILWSLVFATAIIILFIMKYHFDAIVLGYS